MKYGYARVSTQLQNLDLQLDALKSCDKIYTEKVSGSAKNRPVLDELISILKPGDTLTVYKLDRLGRSIRDLLDRIELLKSLGVGFVSITDNMDTTTPQGELIFHIFAAFAQFERSLISERTKAGLTAAKDRGKTLGQPVKWDSQTINKINDLKKKNTKVKDISKILNIPLSSVYRILG